MAPWSLVEEDGFRPPALTDPFPFCLGAWLFGGPRPDGLHSGGLCSDGLRSDGLRSDGLRSDGGPMVPYALTN
jgi:hypothetical protein